MIGFVIFGAGRMGQLYLELIHRDYQPLRSAEVLYVVAGSRDKEPVLQDRFGIGPEQLLTPDAYAKALQDDRVNAAIIASPTSQHEKQILDSLKYGKHVFCEKPISFDTSTVTSCFDVAIANKLWLFCAMQRKFDSQYRKVFEASQSADFGRTVLVKSCSRDHEPPAIEYMQHSGGVICDSAVHDIDLCCWFIGGCPVSVYAVGSACRPEAEAANDLDNVTITLKFAGGAIAVIDVSRRANYGYDQRLEILSSSGCCLKVNNCTPIKKGISSQQDEFTGMEFPRLSFDDCVERYREAYKAELGHFVSNLLDSDRDAIGERSIQEKEANVNVCKVIDAANRSILSGNTEMIV